MILLQSAVYTDSSSFTNTCVCDSIQFITGVGLHVYYHNQDIEQFQYHKDPSHCPFITTSISLPFIPNAACINSLFIFLLSNAPWCVVKISGLIVVWGCYR